MYIFLNNKILKPIISLEENPLILIIIHILRPLIETERLLVIEKGIIKK